MKDSKDVRALNMESLESLAGRAAQILAELKTLRERIPDDEIDRVDYLLDAESELGNAVEGMRLATMDTPPPHEARTEYMSLTQAVSALKDLGRPMNTARLRALCGEGRVIGARKFGRNWVVSRAGLEMLATGVN